MSNKKPSSIRPTVISTNVPPGANGDVVHSIALDGLYQNWFLDYASYVILERAVPRIEDGLKPVQRRIMHSLKEMDDGRFNKVANVIGHSMQYHPHGDAAIGEAMVNLGQKNLLIETQGNWGNILTGDSAAAPRYIEARLSKFALDVVYNPQTTEWQLSYDGRRKEPVTLPVKFPLLLAQGVDGIAVGLSTKILPHNFIELIKASIEVLKERKPKIYPDFPTGGIADFSEYNQGLRGGKIKIRAKIEIADKKTLIIREIPYSTTTTSLMESIVKASEKGQIKIKKVVDNTSSEVEIEIQLQPGQSPEIAIDALYAFTDCEISISPNACVIVEDKPQFMAVNDILKYNTHQTVALLKRELEIKKSELMERILFSSLEKIFIENRIYRDIEEAKTWEEVIARIDKGLKPHKKKFYREITNDDIVRLTEIKIKRISRFDSFKADELMKDLEKQLKETQHHLKNLIEYAVAYYQRLLEKYGKDRERKTEIKNFQSVSATEVIATNQKLYVNRADGFAGFGLKRDEKTELICDCSDLDNVIAIRKDGKMLISRIQEKVFMGKDILYIGIWKKGDDRMIYNVIYSDGKSGRTFAKRFNLPGITRDKEYDLTQGHPNSKLLYVSGNPNGEAEVVEIKLSPSSTARKKIFEYDFSELEIKGRGSKGNTITHYPVKKVDFLKAGTSTLSKIDLWYDEAAGRLNKDGRGKKLGKFDGEDLIIAFMRNGSYKVTNFDLTNRYDPERTLRVEKFNTKKAVSAVYVDGDSKQHIVKRFMIETQTLDKEFNFISEAIGSRLVAVTTSETPEVEVELVKGKDKQKKTEVINLDELVEIKGWKSVGNRLSEFKVTKVSLVEEEEVAEEEESVSNEVTEAENDAQSPKKKVEPEQPEPKTTVEDDGQVTLFAEPPKPKVQSHQQSQSKPKPKVKVEQQTLFGPKAQSQQSKPKNESKEEEISKTGIDKTGGKSFNVGETIEFDL